MRARGGAHALALFSLGAYLFLYAPILVLVAFSFNRGRLTAAWEGFTLGWYLKLLDDVQVLTSLRNSLVVAFAATVICTVLGTAAALALHRHRFRRQAAVEAMVTLPIVVPEIVLASSLVLLFAAAGLRLGFATVILAHIGFSVSYAVVVVRARLAGFDKSLEEAAMDLGAVPFRTLFRVTLPLTQPGIVAGCVLVFIPSLGAYLAPDLLGGARTVYVGNLIQSQFAVARDMPFGSAMSFLLSLLVVALLFAFRRPLRASREL